MIAAELIAAVLAFHGPTSTPCGLTAPPEVQPHDPVVDCSEQQDTGYDDGNPFEITVVELDGKPVEKDTANAFWAMRQAAAADGVDIHIVSGFRTMEEQEYFYMCYTCCCCNNCNLAAQPGYSNHQSGHALDLNTSNAGVYDWLVAHGGEYGFSATVPSEDWHWEWWGGGPGGGVCDIAAAPTGTLDASACAGITGWAQDPDTPASAIEVHVYFDGPAGDPAATGVPVLADDERADLCEPLGSCSHGFEVPVPLSLQDGEAHAVHVYGIDSEGADNAELAASPMQLQCPAPPVPPGVRRRASAEAIAAWELSTFWRMIVIDPAALADIDEWTALGNVPLLVRTADAPEVWLVDAGWRRHVPNPEVAAAWGFDLDAAELVSDEILAQWREGTPVREQPTLVSADGLTVYLIDDAQQGDGGGGSGGAGDSGADPGGDDGDGSGEGSSDDGDGGLPAADGEAAPAGCGCTHDGRGGGLGAMVLVLGAALTRRRRRA